MELKTKLDKAKIEKLTNRLLNERQNDLKRILDIEHRMETVSQKNGVEFVNDSKATDVAATLYSLQCLDKPIVWILSSDMRYRDLRSLKGLVERKVKAMLYIGQQDEDLVEEFIESADLIIQCDNLNDALAESQELIQEGDTVLFSPASPTGEYYESYKERGEHFHELVK